MKLKIRESEFEYDSSATFNVLKDYIKKEFTPSRWNDLEYKFKSVSDDWLTIIVTNKAIWNDSGYGTIVFEAEYKDPYSGVITAYFNGDRYGEFYSQKDYVDWMAEEVEDYLY
jgi:hypothetical protein